jgi:hypothetical protein
MPVSFVKMGAITFTNCAMLAILTTSAFRIKAFKNSAITNASLRLYFSSKAFLPLAAAPLPARYQTLYSSHAM